MSWSISQLSCHHYASGEGNSYIKLLSTNFSIAEWYVEGYMLSIRGVLAPWLLCDSEIYAEIAWSELLINQLSCSHYAAGMGNSYIKLLSMSFPIAEWYVE